MRVLLILMLLACGREKVSSPKEEKIFALGTDERQVWFKTPDEVENEIVSWGINLNMREKSLYISTLGTLYGRFDEDVLDSPLDSPNSVYVLALDIVSNWLSDRLIQKQEMHGSEFMFHGSNAPPDTNNCFADDSEAWCDFDDAITVDMYSKDNPPVSREEKKKIMHNIQDIADFLGLIVDNLLLLPGYDHVPHFILEKIFIPNLKQDDTYAWQKTVHALLMSGQFFMKLNIERRYD